MALIVVSLILFICFDSCSSHSKLSHYGSHGTGDVHYNHLMKHPDCQCDGCAGAYSEWGTCLVAHNQGAVGCGDGVQFRSSAFMTGESCCSRSCSGGNILLQKRPCPIAGHSACSEGSPLTCNYEDDSFDVTDCAIETSTDLASTNYQMVLSTATGTSPIQYNVNGSPLGADIFGFAVANTYAFLDEENTPRYFCLTYKYQLLKNDIIKAFAFPPQIKAASLTPEERTIIVRAAILQNRKLIHTDERSQDMTAPVEVKRTFQHYGDFRIGFVIFPSAVPTAAVDVIFKFSVTGGKCT